MKILAIGAHPDDIEIACAGTLIKCVNRGDKVTVCHLSTGSLGHMVIPPEKLIPMREAEAKKAGSLAGIEVICGGMLDLEIYDNKASRNIVVDINRYADPDIIITHNPDDYMPDHTAVSKLVFDASLTATLPNYASKQKTAVKLPPLYYMDTLAGVNFQPEIYVDVSSEMELKIQMLECHQSQLKWMKEHDGVDFTDFVRTCAKYRGFQCGKTYAEGFKQCRVYLKQTTERQLP